LLPKNHQASFWADDAPADAARAMSVMKSIDVVLPEPIYLIFALASLSIVMLAILDLVW